MRLVSRLSVTFTYRHWTSSVKYPGTFYVRATDVLNRGIASGAKSIRDKMFPNKQENNTP